MRESAPEAAEAGEGVDVGDLADAHRAGVGGHEPLGSAPLSAAQVN
ncbi:hypothetical protein PR003_g25865 [Phytophthora rubi]|uniref:Uncharacterized protein n=1 Tax=Phytophthora rubi TaxID=129364 RepID=A0A6A4CBR9_9STRA|nr:hypothetical protein PR002_g28218 [Phytophthora rubi]KAE8976861.1 hypothetical protein PR001_g25293 [Phytophthora rubi]KAE9288176.1 hypothetical protein PR003_g25865 [Phytophthora rubi]